MIHPLERTAKPEIVLLHSLLRELADPIRSDAIGDT
jgi:hypothetical protein